jgi:PhzF family phenazine biosynthesis protein
MKYPLYQVDAFADKLFSGNPAAVMPLQEWLPEETMQKLAMENNLSETVFFVPQSDKKSADFGIRWFTPAVEINLCGHATLAAAYILFEQLGYDKETIRFSSQSGILTVNKHDSVIKMDFPAWMPEEVSTYSPELSKALGGISIKSVSKNRDLLIEVETEKEVVACAPDFSLIKKLGDKIILTAKGDNYDFVSRFFAPTAGVDEDPVTGSAHAQLIPYWSKKLNKTKLQARQLSSRTGTLQCEYLGDRVMIGGKCIFYMKGEVFLSN